MKVRCWPIRANMAAYAKIPNDVIDEIAKCVHKMHMEDLKTEIATKKYSVLESFFFETENPTFKKLKKLYPDAKVYSEKYEYWEIILVKFDSTKFFLGYYFYEDSVYDTQQSLMEGEVIKNGEVFEIIFDHVWYLDRYSGKKRETLAEFLSGGSSQALSFLYDAFNIQDKYCHKSSAKSRKFINPQELFDRMMKYCNWIFYDDYDD